MTIEKFRGQAKCIIDQYDKYKLPGIDLYINGRMTQGENIADNGGVHESFRAYKKSVDSLGPEPALPGLTQFTPEQMFFVSFSQSLSSFRHRFLAIIDFNL